ncbi:MAG: membrane dipeptidase [Nostoc sp.]|uniref:membrane dipeptidase n=1 Tax=Nostoc sp. TaxID=1180 RepID=UPI002FF2C641
MRIHYQALVRLLSKVNRKIKLKFSNKLVVAKISLFFIVMCLLFSNVLPALTQAPTVLEIQERTIPIDAIKIRTGSEKMAFDNWSFELGLQGWEKTGTAFDSQPTQGNNVVMSRIRSLPLGGDYWQDVAYPIGYKGNYWIGTYENHPKDPHNPLGSIQGDEPTGTLVSQPFVLNHNFITFLIGGGDDIRNLKIELLEKVSAGGTITFSDGQYKEVAAIPATGRNSEVIRREWWNVANYEGKTIRIRIVDNSSKPWGHINIDDIQFTDIEPIAEKIGDAYYDLDAPIWGFVDMHTHLMAYLGFGKKLLHGAPDVGSIIPAGTQNCNLADKKATSIQEALGDDNSTHGKPQGLFDNPCGDFQRNFVIRALEIANEAQSQHGPNSLGYSDDPNKAFVSWPKFNDITHQQMWVNWIQRTYQGGLRVMVALAVNNKTLADGVNGDSPTDDKGSADLQIREIEEFVNRHNDFMEVATSPQQLRSIVRRNKLAVIIGVEIDNIGNFNQVSSLSQEMITEEIQRLYDNKVRYIFPIHVLDNKFGGTAVYQDIFNYSNKKEYGSFWDLSCADPSDGITKQIKGNIAVQFAGAFTGQDPFQNPPIPSCPKEIGHKNRKGLTPKGEFAIKEMMKRGMLIDIDHMSQESANQTLMIAESIPDGYPVNAGHNGFRSQGQQDEYGRTDAQLAKISTLGGMIGVGSGNNVSCEFLNKIRYGLNKMSGKQLAIGTDINGLVKAPRPRNASSDCSGSQVNYAEMPGGLNGLLTMAQTGPKKWNYNTEGVAHYGLIPDFLQDLKNIGMTPQERRSLFMSAEYFAQMWEKSLRISGNVK